MLRLFVLTLLLVVCCTPSVKSWVRTLMRRQVARCAAPSWCFPSRPKPRTKQECCSHQRSHQDIFIVITVRIASHADILLAHQAISPDLPNKRLLAKRMRKIILRVIWGSCFSITGVLWGFKIWHYSNLPVTNLRKTQVSQGTRKKYS